MRWFVKRRVRRRVRRGAKLLDREVGSRWAERIRVADLDMTSAVNCVLGQIYGAYSRGRIHLKLRYQQAHRYGFVCSAVVGPLCSCADLKDAWIAEVEKRRPLVAGQEAPRGGSVSG